MTRDTSDAAQKKMLGMLGLAAKAGKLTYGSELTLEGVLKCRVCLVLLSDSASERTKRKLDERCAELEVEIIRMDIDPTDICRAVGRKRPIVSLGITDKNLAAAVKNIYETTAQQTPRTVTESEG